MGHFIGFSNVLGSVCATLIGFSNVLGSVCATLIGFPNVSDSVCAFLVGFFLCFRESEAEKTLETPIRSTKTMILKLSRPDGVTPADMSKTMVFMVFVSFSTRVILFVFPMFWAPCVQLLCFPTFWTPSMQVLMVFPMLP